MEVLTRKWKTRKGESDEGSYIKKNLSLDSILKVAVLIAGLFTAWYNLSSDVQLLKYKFDQVEKKIDKIDARETYLHGKE